MCRKTTTITTITITLKALPCWGGMGGGEVKISYCKLLLGSF